MSSVPGTAVEVLSVAAAAPALAATMLMTVGLCGNALSSYLSNTNEACGDQLIFAGDACERNPSRLGMGPLVAVGGVFVPVESVHEVERKIEGLCED